MGGSFGAEVGLAEATDDFRDGGGSIVNACSRKDEAIDWLRDALSSSLDNASDVEAVMAGVEVVLDGEDLLNDAVENVVEMLAMEGVSESVLPEFQQRLF